MEYNRSLRSLMELTLLLLFLFEAVVATRSGGGQWAVLQRSVGVSAMHMQLLHNDRVVLFDRTDAGPSNLSLPAGHCRNAPNDLARPVDCTAHSAEYDVAANTFRPLMVSTDTWCSSGAVAADGTLVQTGGYHNGERVARTFRPCDDNGCDWIEAPNALAVLRWYATNHILPDGRTIIIGGLNQFNYEFYPKANPSDLTTFALPFLQETKDRELNNLYPFVHLNIDGNLFVFANNRAILLDYNKNAVVRTYPRIPGGDPRSYPSTGSSVLLPLKPSPTEAEVLICGGARRGSYSKADGKKIFLRALDTCSRIKITDEAPSWTIERMPVPRVMGDMVLLPTGDVLIINGATSGTAGWELGRDPVLTPVVYWPEGKPGARFDVLTAATTPRMYHSSAVLLRDGRVLVGGSNPHEFYNFTNVEFPTELGLDAFSPPYLSTENVASRPRIIGQPPSAPTFQLSYGKQFSLQVVVHAVRKAVVRVTMVSPSFATHSYSMNQRQLVLESKLGGIVDGGARQVVAVAPASNVLAPSGYYMLFVVNGGVPSEGMWVHIQ